MLCSSNQSQFHFWLLQRVRVNSCVEGLPHPIPWLSLPPLRYCLFRSEMWHLHIMPPGTLPLLSTVNTTTVPVIVSVMSGELSTIMYCKFYSQTVSCCPWVASNTQFFGGAWISNRKVTINSIFVTSFNARKVNTCTVQITSGHSILKARCWQYVNIVYIL